MRVIAGQWRGRVLLSPRGDRVRPTTDRVKEAMFSILGPQVRDATVLDLCCGSGGLAIEALSRGARKALLVDASRQSLDTARRNLETCGADPGAYDLVAAEVLKWLPGWLPPEGACCVVADPPYAGEMPGQLLEQIMDRVERGQVQAAIMEHRADLPVGADSPGLRVQTRRYGQSHLTIIRPAPRPGTPTEETP